MTLTLHVLLGQKYTASIMSRMWVMLQYTGEKVEVINLGFKGSFSIDLIISFILVLYIFYICSAMLVNAYENTHQKLSLNSHFAMKIARSYEILSLLSNGRDNEILYSKIHAYDMENVSLKTQRGYVYGGSFDTLCIDRIVYIQDMNEVGVLEVC